MTIKQRIISTVVLSFAFLIVATSTFAQPEAAKAAEPNYEVMLHVLVGSGQAGEALPSTLSPITRQVRADFGTNNLKVINTYLGRISNTGNLEYKGVSNAYVPEPQSGAPSFLDWQLVGLKTMPNASGENAFQFQRFRFGARVPVKVGSFLDHEGKVMAPTNYEAIGLTLDRMSVRENTPTLVGTLTQPKTDGTLFLVLTVRNVDR